MPNLRRSTLSFMVDKENPTFSRWDNCRCFWSRAGDCDHGCIYGCLGVATQHAFFFFKYNFKIFNNRGV